MSNVYSKQECEQLIKNHPELKDQIEKMVNERGYYTDYTYDYQKVNIVGGVQMSPLIDTPCNNPLEYDSDAIDASCQKCGTAVDKNGMAVGGCGDTTCTCDMCGGSPCDGSCWIS